MRLNPKITKHKHSNKDGYYLERRLLHEKIVMEILKASQQQESLLAILMGGGSASGKTWLRGMIKEEQISLGNHFVIIDADEIKEMLPEYEDLSQKEPENMAKFLHDESSDIAFLLLTRCIIERINFIYDGTMKNLQKYESIIETLRNSGYSIKGIVADVNFDEAIARNEKRYSNTGRLVPFHELTKSHIGVANTFFKLKDNLDEYLLYDTFEDYNVFASKTMEDGEIILDQKRLDEFRSKAFLTEVKEDENEKKTS